MEIALKGLFAARPRGRAAEAQFTLGFEYSDCWVEDSRLVVLNAMDAAAAAQAATHDYVLDLDAPEGSPALLSIFGGKITTYRRLAEAAVEKLKPHLPAAPGLPAGWTGTAALRGLGDGLYRMGFRADDMTIGSAAPGALALPGTVEVTEISRSASTPPAPSCSAPRAGASRRGRWGEAV